MRLGYSGHRVAGIAIALVICAGSAGPGWAADEQAQVEQIFSDPTVAAQLATLPAESVASESTAEVPTAGRIDTTPEDGYHALWSGEPGRFGPFDYRVSGGSAFPEGHLPVACHAASAGKTFFVYAGMAQGGERRQEQVRLQVMISCYDQVNRQAARPRRIVTLPAADPREAPAMNLDDAGHLWVFIPSVGTDRAGLVLRSVEPYGMEAFEVVGQAAFLTPQAWWLGESGWMLVHTSAEPIRQPAVTVSKEGADWSEPVSFLAFGGRAEVLSGRHGSKVGVALSVEPDLADGQDLTKTRGNWLYYLQSPDGGKSWQTAQGQPIELPLTAPANPALACDGVTIQRLICLKDLNFDFRGNPVVLYIMSRGDEPGPANNWRTWTTTRWAGNEWETTGLLLAGHNADSGCLHVEERVNWRLLAPTVVGRTAPQGPQPYFAGGEIYAWTSGNMGRFWEPQKLTTGSRNNHNQARRPTDAQPEANTFWCDGYGRGPSVCSLYLATRDGQVYRFPRQMTGDWTTLEPMPLVPPTPVPTPVVPATGSAPALPPGQ